MISESDQETKITASIETLDTCVIGTILKPRGLRGEIKTQIGGFPLETGSVCFIDDVPYKVLNCLHNDNYSYLYLEGITTIEQAELFRNKSIEIDRSVLHLADDEVLASDLIGFAIVDVDDNPLGTLHAIENYGASDIFDCGSFSFPNEDAFVIETNIPDKKIIVRSEMF